MVEKKKKLMLWYHNIPLEQSNTFIESSYSRQKNVLLANILTFS